MKTFVKISMVLLLLAGTGLSAWAQKAKYTVTTKLTEGQGSYDQRKLYREFLADAMHACPYISHFRIVEQTNSQDNHDVVWTYEVSGWDDLTRFYNWVNKRLTSGEDPALKKALTPYAPQYALGGQLTMTRTSPSALARR